MHRYAHHEVQPITGTGGVDDIVTYLQARLNLHKRVSRMKHLPLNARSVLNALDSQNEQHFLDFLDPDVEFRFASQPPCYGKAEVKRSLEEFSKICLKMRHELSHQIRNEDKLIAYGTVLYELANNHQVHVPFCDVWQIAKDERISSYHIYCDSSFMQPYLS